jgi:crossover junction endodeoxyribonuclease RusA
MRWEIILPYPPSGNRLSRHTSKGHYRSPEATAYFNDVWATCREQNAPQGLDFRLRVEYYIAPPDRRRRDLDNCVKVLNDALTFAGVWKDDFQIDELLVVREQQKAISGVRVVIIDKD